MKKLLIAIPLIASAAILTPLTAYQGSPVPGAKDATRVTGGTYNADSGHTLIGWRVSHFGFNDYFGIFGGSTGTLTIDPKNPAAAKVDITIPVSQVTTASAGLTDHLLRAGKDGGKADFFGPAPADARFVSTSVKIDDDGDEAVIVGNLTLNGVTKPVTLDVDFTGAGVNPFNKKETIGFEAETTIKRSDFGVNYGIPVVSDEVELDITAAFEKAG